MNRLGYIVEQINLARERGDIESLAGWAYELTVEAVRITDIIELAAAR